MQCTIIVYQFIWREFEIFFTKNHFHFTYFYSHYMNIRYRDPFALEAHQLIISTLPTLWIHMLQYFWRKKDFFIHTFNSKTITKSKQGCIYGQVLKTHTLHMFIQLEKMQREKSKKMRLNKRKAHLNWFHENEILCKRLTCTDVPYDRKLKVVWSSFSVILGWKLLIFLKLCSHMPRAYAHCPQTCLRMCFFF